EELKPVTLETQRLYLRELNPEIYQHLFTSCSDAEITKFLGLQSDKELEEEKKSFAMGVSTYYVSFKNFLLIDKQTEEVLGKCGFHTWAQKHRRAEVGYHLFQDK